MTEATRPRVSVGVPVRNGGRYLRRALSSILTQEYHDLEVVISDNASSDATSDICLEFARRDGRVRYYRNHENIGAARNYNRVFKLSRGELFKWTAHDDWCDRTFLTRCVEALDAESSAVLCYSGVIFTDESGRVVPYGSWARITTEHGPQPLADLSSPDHRRRHHALQWSCGGPAPFVFGLMRAETLARTGLVRNVPEPDRVLIGELCLVGPFVCVPEPLLFRGPPGHLHRHDWTWLDPANAGHARLATLRLAYHHLDAIARSSHTVHHKMIIAVDTLAAMAVQRTRTKARLWREGRRGDEVCRGDGRM